MSLLDDLSAPSLATPMGPRCTVPRILEKLDEPERSAVQAEIEGDRLTGHELSDRLGRHGIDIGYYSINRHRRRDCRCRA